MAIEDAYNLLLKQLDTSLINQADLAIFLFLTLKYLLPVITYAFKGLLWTVFPKFIT